MLNIFEKLLKIIFSHKIISGILLLVIIAGAWFSSGLINKNQNTTKYVVSTASKGTLIKSVSGTGQVSSYSEITMNSKASGEIAYLGVSAGEEVEEGKLLLKINSSEAEQTIRDAQTSYDLAVLSLEELVAPVDTLSLMQAEDALTAAEDSKINSEADLKKAYDDGFTSVSNVFLDLPEIMSGLNNIIYGNTFYDYQGNADYYAGIVSGLTSKEKINQYKQDCFDKYSLARLAYDENFENYKKINRYSSEQEIESLINETHETNILISDAIKSTNNLIQFYKDELINRKLIPNPVSDTHLSSLNNYTGKTNNFISSLLSLKQTIQNAKNSIVSAERNIIEKQLSLEKIKTGATEINIKSQEMTVAQKKNALLTAQKNLANYYLYAPFSGIVAKININKGETVSSGNSLMTFISKGKIVNISLNEVDISKVSVGNPVNLSFDAIEGLTLVGKVSQIDTIGTVSSGVVNYNVEISFSDDSNQVKPGMSSSVSITTEAKVDVLLVPNSAIKSSDNGYYVEMPETAIEESLLNNNKGVAISGAIQKKTIEIGLANDSYTEIISGINENDQVISSTVSNSSSTSKNSNSTNSNSVKNINTNMMIPGAGGPPN